MTTGQQRSWSTHALSRRADAPSLPVPGPAKTHRLPNTRPVSPSRRTNPGRACACQGPPTSRSWAAARHLAPTCLVRPSPVSTHRLANPGPLRAISHRLPVPAPAKTHRLANTSRTTPSRADYPCRTRPSLADPSRRGQPRRPRTQQRAPTGRTTPTPPVPHRPPSPQRRASSRLRSPTPIFTGRADRAQAPREKEQDP